MDLFRKFLGLNTSQEDGNDKGKKKGHRNNFLKPTWYEENETDDELQDELFDGKFFGPQIFANSADLEKHFDRHLQELLKTFDDHEAGNKLNEDMGRFPSIWGSLESKAVDDKEFNPAKMKEILKSVTPRTPKKRLTDEETIMARIHGTEPKEEESRKPTRPRYVPKMTPMHPNFESSVPIPGAKIFGQSIMTETVRKPDGSVESRRVVRDMDGNVKTTISRTVDGETKTVTTFSGKEQESEKRSEDSVLDSNFFLSPSGYTLPRNLW
ncbi:uncharacterized protein LOC132262636 [Phlebotomus argentipes]|uniref:uncharacterized protein LOC132262636 n=1 Tax=Phlebotomus argentipes TaxID=94469 RepID=UPI0028935309|nr:uncharacterized protein LOC132262636 [Phlebotomus argentipes]